jgi:hypothetical protein
MLTSSMRAGDALQRGCDGRPRDELDQGGDGAARVGRFCSIAGIRGDCTLEEERRPEVDVPDEEHFFIDLVFYNRLLKCYVLIDLKIGKLTHQDLGQMQMYVNYQDDRSTS